MKFAVSTVGFSNIPINTIIELAKDHHFALEFSSGLPFREDMENIYLNADIERLPHNYFPAPQIPFVLNLASDNDEIRGKSILHCIHGLELAKKSNSPFYSAHAGFCIDPKPDDLGRKLIQDEQINREKHWEYFIDSVLLILKKSDETGIDFLIENNVAAAMNIRSDNTHPLLCAEPDEILRLAEEIPHRRLGLLLDTAHLKVSANALKFNLDDGLTKINEFIRGFHHSDNDGIFDTNEYLNVNYWFLKHMSKFKDKTHVLEIKKMSPEKIKEHRELILSYI